MHVVVTVEDELSLLGGDLDVDAVLDEEVWSGELLSIGE